MESMPWHCVPCRALNREEKKALKASNETAAIPASVPLIEIQGADSEDALAEADANHWNEILTWDDECDVNLMIASSLVHGGPDRVWDVCHNQVKCLVSSFHLLVSITLMCDATNLHVENHEILGAKPRMQSPCYVLLKRFSYR